MAGAWSTVSVKLCGADAPTALLAVIAIEYVPPLPAAGVPLSTPALLSVTPEGSAPVSANVGAGLPAPVTVNVPAAPTVKVALAALVIVGTAPVTVSVKLCDAAMPSPLLAVKVIGYVPGAVDAATVSVGLVNVTPAGSVPASVKVGAGKPLAVTVNDPATPVATV